jgi:hypothetical protein
MKKERKMTKVYKNVRTMYYPVKSEKMVPSVKIDVLIEETESDIYKVLGDNPLVETLASPKALYLQKRLALLLKKKENITRTKKHRDRHQVNKIRIEEVI